MPRAAPPLIVDIAANLARLASDMAQAKGIVESSSRDIASAAGIAKDALGALGIGLSVNYFVGLVKGAFDAQEHLLHLARTSASTVEALSSVQLIAKSTDTDMHALAMGMAMLAQSMSASADAGSKQAKVFGALKIATIDATTGALRPTQEVMRELAAKLSTMTDQTLAVGLALELLGMKAGPKLIPFLYELGQAGELNAKISTQQAKAAAEFNDKLKLLSEQAELAKISFANELLPALVSITNQFIAAKEGASGFYNSIERFLSVSGKQAADPETALAQIEARLAKLRADREVLAGPSLGAKFNRMMAPEDLATLNQQITFAERQKSVLEPLYRMQLQQRGREANSPFFDFAGGGIPLDPRNPLGDKTNGKTAADILNEAAGVSKDFFEDLGKLHAEFESGRISIESYRTAVAGLIDKQAFAHKLTQQRKEVETSLEATMKLRAETDEKQSEVLANAFRSLRDYTQQQQFELETMGLSELERQKLTEFRRIDMEVTKLSTSATVEQMAAIAQWGAEAKKAYGDALEVKTRYADQDARIGDALAQQREMQSQAGRTRDVLSQSIADGIMRGFERGEGFWENFRDSIRRAAITITINPVVQGVGGAVAAPFASAASSAMGAIGLGGGGLGGVGGLLGIMQNMGGAYSASSLVNSMSGVSLGLSTIVEDMAGNITFAPTAAGSAIGAVGTVLPYLPGAMRLMQGDTAGGIGSLAGTAIGSYFGGPIGGAIGGTIGGAVFGESGGRGPKPGEVSLFQDAAGNFRFGNNNLPNRQDAANEAYLLQASQALNDRSRYDPRTLRQFVGQSVSGVGSAEEGVQRLLQVLEPAHQVAIQQLQTQQALLKAQEDINRTMQNLADTMDERLGIPLLEQARDALLTSEYRSPTDRFSAARDILNRTYSSATAGNLTDVQAFPEVLQSALRIGRDTYASGPEFAALFTEGNRMLNDLLEKQRQARDDIMKDLPATIMQSGQDTVEAIRRQTAELVRAQAETRDELRRLRAEMAA